MYCTVSMARVVKPSPCSLHSLFPLHLQSYLTPEAGVEVEELPEDLVERGHLGGLIASSVWQGKTQITTKRLSLSSSHRIVMDNALFDGAFNRRRRRSSNRFEWLRRLFLPAQFARAPPPPPRKLFTGLIKISQWEVLCLGRSRAMHFIQGSAK